MNKDSDVGTIYAIIHDPENDFIPGYKVDGRLVTVIEYSETSSVIKLYLQSSNLFLEHLLPVTSDEKCKYLILLDTSNPFIQLALS